MTEQHYHCVIPVGAIEDIGYFTSWLSHENIFEWTNQNMKYPFGVRCPSTAHSYTHIFSSNIEDSITIKESYPEYEVFTSSTDWGTPTQPAHYMTLDDYYNKDQYYSIDKHMVYSDLCTIDDIIAFKLKNSITPYYSGKTWEEYYNMVDEIIPWYHRKDINIYLRSLDDQTNTSR